MAANGSIWKTRAGWVFSALVGLALIGSSTMKLSAKPDFVDMFSQHFGYPSGTLAVIGALELTVALLYLAPPTAVFGAILVTGYLGGAVATHVRVGEGFFPPLILGILAWVGLYLREARIRALFPLRRAE